LKLNRLLLIGGALTLLVVVIVAVVLLASGGSDSGGSAAGEEADVPLGPGFVWIDGKWLTPPFIVETDASVIRINGRLVRRVTRLESLDEAQANQPEGSLGELLEAAAMHYDETGGTSEEPPSDERVAELTQFVEALPNATAVSFEAPALSITDETGQTGYVILQRPSPLTEEQNVRSLQSTTTRWTLSLRGGDALLFSGDVTLEVPARNAVDFLNALVAVFDLPEGEQAQAMLDLVGEKQMADELVAAGRPPAALTDRLADLTPEEPSLVAQARQQGKEGEAAADDGQLRTPSANKAYIFQPIEVEGPDWCFPDPLIQTALDHGYQVIHLRGKASTLDAAVESSERAAIFYVCGQWHAIEPMATRADAMFKVGQYRDALGLTDQDVYPIVSISRRTFDKSPVPQYYIGAGTGFYEKLWKSAGTVVFLSQCYSNDLAPGFDVREFMALDNKCFGIEAERQREADFFAQLDGTAGADLDRSIGGAFKTVLADTGWVLGGSGGGNTVLSPAVIEHEPQTAVAASSATPIRGHVTFDTPMYQSVDAVLDHVVRVKGCAATLTDTRWADPYTLEFEFTTGQDAEADPAGPLTIAVDAEWAASGSDVWLKLDGNQEPPDTEHVGPSEDDFVWSVDCTP
jgi:hypothetical protein